MGLRRNRGPLPRLRPQYRPSVTLAQFHRDVGSSMVTIRVSGNGRVQPPTSPHGSFFARFSPQIDAVLT